MKLIKFDVWKSRECCSNETFKQVRYNYVVKIMLFGFRWKALEWTTYTMIFDTENGDWESIK